MNKRECKRLFYKESVRSLLITGWALGYISPNAINYVTKKLEKNYKVCSQSEWNSAIDRLNVWFKDASLKIKEL